MRINIIVSQKAGSLYYDGIQLSILDVKILYHFSTTIFRLATNPAEVLMRYT